MLLQKPSMCRWIPRPRRLPRSMICGKSGPDWMRKRIGFRTSPRAFQRTRRLRRMRPRSCFKAFSNSGRRLQTALSRLVMLLRKLSMCPWIPRPLLRRRWRICVKSGPDWMRKRIGLGISLRASQRTRRLRRMRLRSFFKAYSNSGRRLQTA